MKRFFDRRPYIREQKRIVIAGTQRGAGVTHLALTLANVSAARERRKTLYLEIGQQGNISALRTRDTLAVDGMVGFCLYGVVYLPHVSAEAACSLFSDRTWDVIVCDVTEQAGTKLLLAACTRSLLICDVKPWNYTVFQQNMKEWMRERNKKRADLFSLHLQKQDEKRCREEFGMRIEALPFIEDPFRMTHAQAAEAAKIL